MIRFNVQQQRFKQHGSLSPTEPSAYLGAEAFFLWVIWHRAAQDQGE